MKILCKARKGVGKRAHFVHFQMFINFYGQKNNSKIVVSQNEKLTILLLVDDLALVVEFGEQSRHLVHVIAKLNLKGKYFNSKFNF